tara:strand:- start:101 stop:838 length:738 start_codon:yes stop_codon:yes gene_type:complete
MATNFYFQNGDTSGTTSEQRLVESLVVESLKIYGHDIFYLPRTLVNRDTIFDEDALSKFTQSYPLEMYLENVEGFEGEGDIFQKFGIEIRDSATFVLAKKRWDDLVDTSGGTFQLEARPAEGDLLYFAKTGSLFEIKFVEFQNPFYQLGKIYVFRLQCELFEYSSEALDTGNTEIDAIEDGNSLDTFLYQLKTETGDNLLTETRDALIKEDFATNKTNANTDNADFMNFSDILDFTEVNPFGEVG